MIDMAAILNRHQLLIKNLALLGFHEDANPMRDVVFIDCRNLKAIASLGFAFARGIPSWCSTPLLHAKPIAPLLPEIIGLRNAKD